MSGSGPVTESQSLSDSLSAPSTARGAPHAPAIGCVELGMGSSVILSPVALLLAEMPLGILWIMVALPICRAVAIRWDQVE